MIRYNGTIREVIKCLKSASELETQRRSINSELKKNNFINGIDQL